MLKNEMVAIKEIFSSSVGCRVIIEYYNNVIYTGTVRGILHLNNKEGGVLEIDAFSGLCLWLPMDFIKEIVLVPLQK